MKSKKIWWTLAATLAFLIAGWTYYSPYYAIHQLQKAAEEGDPVALTQYVDFPALRDSVRGQIVERMRSSMGDNKDNPFANVGAAFAIAMVGPVVDATVTPQAIAAMTKGKTPLPEQQKTPTEATASETAQSSEDESIKVQRGYVDFNRFEITTTNTGMSGKASKVIFLRQGFGWKLVAIDFPF
jgi:hypothetical protein